MARREHGGILPGARGHAGRTARISPAVVLLGYLHPTAVRFTENQYSWAGGVRVVRRYLRAALESLCRYEELLAAEASLSDAELARAVEANRRTLAKSWARAQHTFERARNREVRVERAPRTYRARARHHRPTYRRRTPRRATRLSAVASAGDGSPPPEPDPAQQLDPQDASPVGGGS